MSFLFEQFYTECQMMDKSSAPGPTGPVYHWTPGAKFKAAVIKDQTLAAKVAEKEGVTEVYKVTTPPAVSLDFHDVFKRLSDGATFRVTTNSADSQSPKDSGIQFAQVTAERWDIPT